VAVTHRLPAVILRKGDVIEVDGEPAVIESSKRVENGPKYEVHTDRGSRVYGAAQRITVIQIAR
jgi:ribosomal protein S8E